MELAALWGVSQRPLSTSAPIDTDSRLCQQAQGVRKVLDCTGHVLEGKRAGGILGQLLSLIDV